MNESGNFSDSVGDLMRTLIFWLSVVSIFGLLTPDAMADWRDEFDGASELTWVVPPFSSGGFEVAGDDLVLNGANAAEASEIITAFVESESFGDTSISTRFAMQDAATVMVFGRADPSLVDGYMAQYAPWSGDVSIVRLINGTPTTLASDNDRVRFDDVFVQFDVVGEQMALKVWGEGEAIPEDATLVATDDLFSSGVVGLGLRENSIRPNPVVRFRYAEAVAVPEPTAMSATFWILSLCLRRRKR